MKNTIEEYIPFEHKNLEYINGSLNLARQQRQSGTLEGLMAAAVIYTNLVEYLASNLLENLQQMISILSYHNFHGVFFVKNQGKTKQKSPQTLGQLRHSLTNYEFPDSPDFIASIQKFAETRNTIFHRLLKLSKEEMDKGVVDRQFSDLHQFAEEILDKYNAITKGITTLWYSVMKPQSPPESPTKEQLQSQIEALLGQIAALQTQLAESENSKQNK